MIIKRTLSVLGLIVVAALVARSFSDSKRETNNMQDKRQEGAKSERPDFSKSGYKIAALDEDRIGELASSLTAEQRQILLEEGTERAFTGSLAKNKKQGIYTCRLCGLPLYESDAKFESGTGWPSFYKPLDAGHVREVRDTKLGSMRTEVECVRCRSHLGHVFDDGPAPTGLRYCMNSAALRFYETGAQLPPESQPAELATAYFAGGCFWGIEDQFQQVPGVIAAVSGYQGGHLANPGYKQVCRGSTGHAETVRVTFDPGQVSYPKLLDWFFRFHNPTQKNRQGPDIGTQYRSAIFAANDEQLDAASAFIKAQQASTRFRDHPIATIVERAGEFFEAEEYHQDYHAKHGGSCSIDSGE